MDYGKRSASDRVKTLIWKLTFSSWTGSLRVYKDARAKFCDKLISSARVMEIYREIAIVVS
ncbi:hypothetical protein COOONC_20733 [Cooperia oncophora]